jgi:hypothetical protein
MSDPDSTPRRRAPTIDLTATEIEAQKPASAAEAGTNDPAGEAAKTENSSGEAAAIRPRSRRAAFVSIAAGIVAIAAVGAGLWFAGYLPPSQPEAPSQPAAPSQAAASPSAQPANNAAIADITARLKKLEGATQARPPDTALTSRVAAAEATAKSLGEELAALTHRVDDVATAAQAALAQAKSAAGAAEAAKNGAQAGVAHSDLDALANRIAALESAVKSLADNIKHETASADDRVARLMVATEALRAAIERGAPYQAELAAVKSLGVDQGATAPLEPFAAGGVPSAVTLAHELAALAPALRQAAEPAAGNRSFLERLEANAQQLVRLTPVNAPAGDDPASVMARINADAARADIAAALADIAKLPDAAKSLTAAWVQKAQARDAAIAAGRHIAADALAALGKPSPQ